MTTADLDIALDMTVEEHVETALIFLEQSQQEFGVGDTLQGSEKLWGAVAHGAVAIALMRGWPCGSHYSLKTVAGRLADENYDRSLRLAFAVAEKFHANFYHGFMRDYQLNEDIPIVRAFAEQLVSMAHSTSEE